MFNTNKSILTHMWSMLLTNCRVQSAALPDHVMCLWAHRPPTFLLCLRTSSSLISHFRGRFFQATGKYKYTISADFFICMCSLYFFHLSWLTVGRINMDPLRAVGKIHHHTCCHTWILCCSLRPLAASLGYLQVLPFGLQTAWCMANSLML